MLSPLRCTILQFTCLGPYIGLSSGPIGLGLLATALLPWLPPALFFR